MGAREDTVDATATHRLARSVALLSRRKRPVPLWWEVVVSLVTAVVLALLVKTFLVQAFYIPSGSMEPTLMVNDRILVQKLSYWRGEVRRGDVVVFDDPGGWLGTAEPSRNAAQRALEVVGLYPAGGHLVKRVIGVGGDDVRCCNAAGRLTVNGVALAELYVLDPTVVADERFHVRVPRGDLWVMGDNRGDSADSRAHLGDPGGGFLPARDVIGKAWVTLWPAHRIGGFTRPATFDAVRGAGS